MSHRFAWGLFIAAAVLISGLLVAFAVGRYPIGLGELLERLVRHSMIGEGMSQNELGFPVVGIEPDGVPR